MRGIIAAVVVAAALAAAAAEPKLVDEKLVLPAKGIPARGKWWPVLSRLGCMNLSPDGRLLLYLQKTRSPVQVAGSQRSVRRLVLRDLAKQTDTVLPIPAVTSDDVFDYLFSGRMFDPAGRKIVLGVGIDADGDGYVEPGHTGRMRAALYDVASGKLTQLDLEGPTVLPGFDPAGRTIYALCYDLAKDTGTLYAADAAKPRFRRRKIVGLPRGHCPAADVMAVLVKRPEKGALDRRLVLYDVKTDQRKLELPLTGHGWNLIRTPPRWTADGRYLYYRDNRLKPVVYFSAVWDRARGKPAAPAERLIPVGPGPTPTTMVMIKVEGGNKRQIHLHDAATGKSWRLAGKQARPLAAAAGRVLYVKWTDDGDALFSARIAAGPPSSLRLRH